MGNEDKVRAVLSSPLDGLINVGKCEDYMPTDNARLDRHETLIGAAQQEHARCQAEVQGQLRTITANLSRQEKSIDKLIDVTGKLVSKLNNGINERVDYIEREISDRVTREEFNGAMNGMRVSINTLKWIFGLTFPAVLGALVTLVVMYIS